MKVAALILSAATLAAPAPRPAEAPKPMRLAAVCFKTTEETPPNSTVKYCHYSCLGTDYIIAVKVTTVCPINIER